MKLIKTAIVICLGIAVYCLLPDSCPEPAKRTAFIFVFAACFWALEVIPLYATSLFVVLLEVLLLSVTGERIGMQQADYRTFLLPFASPVIILFFGGFVLAGAMRKYELDQKIAAGLVRFFGSKPYFILLGFMLTTGFLSMWLSNTATTAMMLAMVTPLIAKLDGDDLFRKGLALAIAFGANLGGVGTPVGTPPNAIALGMLADQGVNINFLDWVIVAMPLALSLMLLASFVLMFFFKPKHESLSLGLRVEGKLTAKSIGVLFVVVATILLWLTSRWHHIPESVVALLAVGGMTGCGLVTKEDLRNIDWDILVLMWGGLALGKGMEISGLADWVVGLPIFGGQGFWLLILFCILAVVFSTLISNTATANLLIPIALSVPGQNLALLGVTVALACSMSMALPVSTPPNAMVFSSGVIKGGDMLKSGLVMSLMGVIAVLMVLRIIIRIYGLS